MRRWEEQQQSLKPVPPTQKGSISCCIELYGMAIPLLSLHKADRQNLVGYRKKSVCLHVYEALHSKCLHINISSRRYSYTTMYNLLRLDVNCSLCKADKVK